MDTSVEWACQGYTGIVEKPGVPEDNTPTEEFKPGADGQGKFCAYPASAVQIVCDGLGA